MRIRALAVLATLTLLGCGGSEPPAAAPSAPAAEGEAEQASTIEVYCNPPTPILVDGKPVGTSPLKGVKVTPGKHDVTFADPKEGNRTMSVTVGPGENQVVTSDRPH